MTRPAPSTAQGTLISTPWQATVLYAQLIADRQWLQAQRPQQVSGTLADGPTGQWERQPMSNQRNRNATVAAA